MSERVIGVIGGSGLYEISELTHVEEVRVDTPFGAPSDALICGRLGDTRMVFLPRHGRGHRFNPSEVPYRANIWAMKSLGVDWIISVSAVGSLKEEIVPGHVVLVDQFLDRTKGIRPSTFFENGIVAHVAFADPISHLLQEALLGAAREVGATVHVGGTYVCMEGPAFSTKAESHWYRSLGASVIGMTNLTEAKLAREAEIAYATVALATDYDCWHPHHDSVTVDAIIATLNANVALARRLIVAAVPRVPAGQDPACANALQFAVMTRRDLIPDRALADLAPLLGRYFPERSSS